MRVSFACPSCAARGSADAVHVGRRVRCKHCGADFTVPSPDADDGEPDVYALEEPVGPTAQWVPQGADRDAVFVPARREPRGDAGSPRPARRTPSGTTTRRQETSSPVWSWLIWIVGGLALVLVLMALLAPNGLWLAGCILIVLGMPMVIAGYAAGAYGAFQEDALYGLAYLAIPLFTAYYMVTRWEDLWVWLVTSTVGVGLILLGTELIRQAGAPI